eukprot:12333581-Ditylum_brightwellii.AAC.1
MPSPNANSVLINPDPKVIQYNIHDPPYLTNNTEEDEKENEDQSVADHDNDDSDCEDQDNASQD